MPQIAPFLLTALVASALTLACGAPPCAGSAACGAGRVCGFDGRCGPLEGTSRFADARWLYARDWAIASRAEPPRADVLLVGGGAESLLAFGPLPAPSTIGRALLVLHPRDARIVEGGELVVEHIEPFRGGRMSARLVAAPVAFAAARASLTAGPARPARIDVTEVARESAARRDRTLYLLLRLLAGPSTGVHFASPWAVDPRAHPRLELTLH